MKQQKDMLDIVCLEKIGTILRGQNMNRAERMAKSQQRQGEKEKKTKKIVAGLKKKDYIGI